MSEIRYVCLSDLHLGDDGSLLTYLDIDQSTASKQAPGTSPVLVGLRDCLECLLDGARPVLILLGDTLEFALASPNEAFMVFDQFLDTVGALFSEIIYVPGNHDHHLWETARETQYVRYVRGVHKPGGLPRPVGQWLAEPWHTTYMMEPTDLSIDVLAAIKDRHSQLSSLKINCVYPNYAVFGNGRFHVFTHGHYLESLYRLGSLLKESAWELPWPVNCDELEIDNFAWVDFFWSTMGQTGQLGQKAKDAYRQVTLGRIPKEVVCNVAKRLIRNRWLGTIAGKFISCIAGPVVMEKGGDDPFGDELKRQVGEYLGKYVWRELQRERISSASSLAQKQAALQGLLTDASVRAATEESARRLRRVADCGPESAQFTFIFGHTHKPFAGSLPVAMPADEPGSAGKARAVSVCNLGGWVVEDVAPRPSRGASAFLVDSDFNGVWLPMYVEEGPAPMPVATGPAPSNELLTKVTQFLVNQKLGAFRKCAGEMSELRQKRLAARSVAPAVSVRQPFDWT